MKIDGLDWIDNELRMPLTVLPVRSVVGTVGDGRVLFSPSRVMTPAQLAAAGTVTDIVAPNLYHSGGVKGALAAHPKARVWGPKGVHEKAPELPWRVFGQDPWPHEAVFQPFLIEGMPKFNEWVFLHKASRTLLISDFAFNITDPKGIGGWALYSVFGTYRRLGVSRLFLKLVQDRAAFTASLKRIIDLPFDNLVMSHGQPIEGGAREKLIAASRDRKLDV